MWPTPPVTPRDAVLEEMAARESRSAQTQHMLELIEERRIAESGDAIQDLRDIGEGWMQCLTEKGSVFFFNVETGESLWERPSHLPPDPHAEDDFNVEGIDPPRTEGSLPLNRGPLTDSARSSGWGVPSDDGRASTLLSSITPRSDSGGVVGRYSRDGRTNEPDFDATELVSKIIHHTRLVSLGAVKVASTSFY